MSHWRVLKPSYHHCKDGALKWSMVCQNNLCPLTLACLEWSICSPNHKTYQILNNHSVRSVCCILSRPLETCADLLCRIYHFTHGSSYKIWDNCFHLRLKLKSPVLTLRQVISFSSTCSCQPQIKGKSPSFCYRTTCAIRGVGRRESHPDTL